MGSPKINTLLVCTDNITRNHRAKLELRVDVAMKHLIQPSKIQPKAMGECRDRKGKQEKKLWLGMLSAID